MRFAEVSGGVWAVTEDMAEVSAMLRGVEELTEWLTTGSEVVLAAVRGGKGQRSISKSQRLHKFRQEFTGPSRHPLSQSLPHPPPGLLAPPWLSHRFMKSSGC